jgi:hypothetical protein
MAINLSLYFHLFLLVVYDCFNSPAFFDVENGINISIEKKGLRSILFLASSLSDFRKP